MDIGNKTKININFSGLFERIKKEFKDDYFKLTYFYFAVYGLFLSVIVYGIQYLSTGSIEFNNLRSEMVIGLGSLMGTMATMAKKLKDDIVNNYWKLVRSSRRKKPSSKVKKS